MGNEAVPVESSQGVIITFPVVLSIVTLEVTCKLEFTFGNNKTEQPDNDGWFLWNIAEMKYATLALSDPIDTHALFGAFSQKTVTLNEVGGYSKEVGSLLDKLAAMFKP